MLEDVCVSGHQATTKASREGHILRTERQCPRRSLAALVTCRSCLCRREFHPELQSCDLLEQLSFGPTCRLPSTGLCLEPANGFLGLTASGNACRFLQRCMNISGTRPHGQRHCLHVRQRTAEDQRMQNECTVRHQAEQMTRGYFGLAVLPGRGGLSRRCRSRRREALPSSGAYVRNGSARNRSVVPGES